MYALGKSLAATEYNSEFVCRVEIEEPERIGLCRPTRNTGAIQIARKLDALGDLCRHRSGSFGEPVSRPCTVEQTWESIHSRWPKQDMRTIAVPVARRTAGRRSAGLVIK